MSIYLIRHGLSEGNSRGVYQGGLDFELTKFGRLQAQALGRWLSQFGATPGRIYTSPQTRARQTAEELATLLGTPELIVDADIKEFDGGRIEGLSFEDVRRDHPGFEDRPLGERIDMSFFGGESYEQIQTRVRRFIARVEVEYTGADICIVSHGGTLHQLICNWCGWPTPRHILSRFSNCCCHKLELETVGGEGIGRIQWFITLELIAPDLAMSPVNPSRM